MTSSAPATVPACRHLLEEVSLKLPFWRYYRTFQSSPYSFLRDSATDSLKLGRFSFLGRDPFLVYRAKRIAGSRPRLCARIKILEFASPDGQRLRKPVATMYRSNPFYDLKELMKRYSVDADQYFSRPVPFLMGAVGYFGYEAGYFVEQLPDLGCDDLKLPDVYFMFFDCLLGHCHKSGKSFVSVMGRGKTETLAHRSALALRDRILSQIEAFESNPLPERPTISPQQALRTKIDVTAHFDELNYCRAVTKVKHHIMAGDIFQACLTHRSESPLEGGQPWDLYEELRRVNPSPFACYLNFPEAQVVSASPERFLALDENGLAESRPIKGTRPRGSSVQQDDQLREDLLRSTKDRAENLMIVDLVRSDLGRVCKFQTVSVPEFMIIEPYATVFQMVSTIRGELRPEICAVDLIKACFPGGSMTGAPKIQAMKIIEELEPVKRGIYSGSIGYLDFSGPLDLNIVIRSFIVKDDRCYYNVGGAIVADSNPKEEFAETMDKARALKLALANLKAAGSFVSN